MNKQELEFLRSLAAKPRSNTWVIQNFGLGRAYDMLRRGLVVNPLGEDENHTNLWQPSRQGYSFMQKGGAALK
ncbi:MAG: hypothetical protein RBS68_15740 [Anaerolineales bacterium]|jgi:hypothetical protein|nr:hypothetical protein [Anaerolineales bacterium]